MSDKILRSCIIKKEGPSVSMNGTYSEIENFVLENMGNIKSCRTIVRGEPNKFIDELCMKDC
ncbi:MAG: hypothetical protein GF317_14900 [Candidatus Lokiarchaeota archaeon]|nr:hypothetical protein [Candidatus Lokiarchaeota archaeon]